jgi:glutamine amidotransferase
MCLIAYVPEGKRLPPENFLAAHERNPDGIGIMSVDGVQKFLGRKAAKRAKKYIDQLQDDNVAYAIHFRYATHGDITLRNCHPFELPNGNGWLMHNGVLRDYTDLATRLDSDTAIFAREHVDAAASGTDTWKDYWSAIGQKIDRNKLVIMLPSGFFIIVNGSYGTYRDDIWYSQTYSLPWPRSDFEYGGANRPYNGSYNWLRQYDARREEKPSLPIPWDAPTAPYRTLTESLERHYPMERSEPLEADKLLDKELLEAFKGTNCISCYRADIPIDKDGICADCLYTDAKQEDSGLLPGWSAVTEPGEKAAIAKHKDRCVDCEASVEAGEWYCGHAYCVGKGYEMAGEGK